MGVSSLFSYLLFSLTAYQALSQSTPPPCCKTKTVTNAPTPAPGQDSLNGEYVLKESSTSTSDKPDPNCADGCVYTKDNEEYCFKNVPVVEAADIVCDATTGGPGAAGTTPGAGAVTPGAGASTPGAGESTPGAGASTPEAGASTPEAGASTPGAGTPGAGATTPGGAGTTLGVAAQGQAAQERLKQSKEDKTEAEATKKAATDSETTTTGVQSKIDAVISGSAGTTVANGRMKRQATPTTCEEFNTQIKNMNTEINKNTKDGFTQAAILGNILLGVDANTITCDTAALAALKETKTAVAEAKSKITKEIAVQQNKIKALIEKINADIATIKEVNEKLVAAGQTAFADPGTLLPTVTAAIIPTEAPAAGATTPVGGAGETSPAGGAGGATTPAGGASTPAGGATTPAGGETTPAGGAGATMVSTANPNARQLLFGKRSRGSIM